MKSHKTLLLSLCFALIYFQIYVKSQDDEGAEEGADAGGEGAAEGGETPAKDGDGGNGTDGEKLWEDWNKYGQDENDTTWLIKFCPRGLIENYTSICTMHCWWNGWQGGFCTDEDICVCRWDGLMEDKARGDSNSIKLPTTTPGAAPAGDDAKKEGGEEGAAEEGGGGEEEAPAE